MMLLNVFHHGPAELLLDPSALRHARLNRFDAAIALARVVVACIDDDHPLFRACKQSGRQTRNAFLGDGHDDQSHAPNRFADRDGGCAGLCGQVAERLRSS
jgi:hypothetical protein